jgi:cytochrome P450
VVGHDGPGVRPRDPDPFDPASVAVQASPYAVYGELLARDPIHRGGAPDPAQGTCWYFFRHEDVKAALKDPRFGRERPLAPLSGGEPDAADADHHDNDWLLYRDPPFHTTERAWLQEALDARLVAHAEPRIERLAHGLLARVPPSGVFDLQRGFAEKLPAAVLAELIGFDDPLAERFAEAVEQMLAPSLARRRPPFEHQVAAGRARAILARSLEHLLAERRLDLRSDLASALIDTQRRHPACGGRDLGRTLLFLVTTGYEVTVGLLGSGLFALLETPGLWGAARSGQIPVAAIVEEALRHESPLQMVDRWVLEDLVLDGKILRRGERVYLVLGAANRDPAHFSKPERLDVDRGARGHLAFGAGPHGCLGANLARTMARVAFTTLLGHASELQLGEPTARFYPDINFRVLQRLNVNCTREK